MAKKKSGMGMFDALTMKQTDGLAIRLLEGQRRLGDDPVSVSTAREIIDVVKDLHESWCTRFDQGERGLSARARKAKS